MLKSFFVKDWQYKLLALFMGATFWFIHNFGGRVPMNVERYVEVFNQKEGYAYRLERKRVRLKLSVMERFVSEEMVENIRVGVDVKGLEEGEYLLKVYVVNVPRFIISVEKIEPDYIRVKVIKAPNRGHLKSSTREGATATTRT
ncbi:MAG: hypothetical protein ACK4LT_00745 [Aquificaceae bacterium]